MVQSFGNRRFYNFIWILVLAVVFLVSMFGGQRLEAVALEQETRCGQVEHIHTSECYMDSILMCDLKAHTHSDNCYLLRLEDNDINWLLLTVDRSAGKSLESVLNSAMVQTLVLNDRTEAASLLAGPTQTTDTAISGNQPATYAIQPSTTDSNTPIAREVQPATEGAYVNFYIWLDDRFVCIGNLAVTDNKNKDYITKTEIARLHNTEEIISNIVQNNIETGNTSLQIRYSTTQITPGATKETYKETYYKNIETDNANTNWIKFDNIINNGKGSPRYAVVLNGTGKDKYELIEFYTVTLDYSAITDAAVSTQKQYVQSGLNSTMTLSEEYLWYLDAAGTTLATADDLENITKTTTLYARPKAYTASFENQAGESIRDPITGKPAGRDLTITLPTLDGTDYEGYLWVIKDSTNQAAYESDGNDQVVIRADTTFVAVPSTYQITFIGVDGTQQTITVNYGERIDFAALEELGVTVTLPSNGVWVGDDNGIYEANQKTNPITKDMQFTATNQVSVEYVYLNGNVTKQLYKPGTEITVPAVSNSKYTWVDQNGNEYTAGDKVVLTEPMQFRESEKINLVYNVNFPSDIANSVDAIPNLYGTNSKTATDTIISGSSATLRSLEFTKARQQVNDNNKESVTHLFKGWTVNGTDVVIPADSTLSWNDLKAYADSNGNVNLQGVWEKGNAKNSVTFYVKFNSVAIDTEGNIGNHDYADYTPEIFHTRLGGLPDSETSWTTTQLNNKYAIADTTADNSFGADQEIRSLYGERADSLWMYDFPNDNDVFAYLKNYLENNPNRQLTVEGTPVKIDELDSKHYAIRWYVFKSQNNSWHVDGKLVAKEGVITISKKFVGEQSAINIAKNGFTVTAQNGTMVDGIFTPYTDANLKKHILKLNEASTIGTNSYQWKITNITLDEYWQVLESPIGVDGYSYYTEYSVFDSDGEITDIAKYGTIASVVGKTFALDEDKDQGMRVSFTNYYYREDSILLKKEDKMTGQGIPGAGFQITQNGHVLNFTKNADGSYTQDPSARNQLITTGPDGYVAIDGFSYQYGADQEENRGNILVDEVVVPTGYEGVSTLKLSLDADGNVVVTDPNSTNDPPIPISSDIAEIRNNNQILIVKNTISSTELVSVTANKVWNTSTPADSVGVVLQANGQHVSTVLPGISNAQVELNAQNNWSYTWQDLPRYANGELITWGIKEVMIGGIPPMADGSSFANWIPTYSPGIPVDVDGDGDIDNWSYTVTNTTRRPQLILTKLGTNGKALQGATFKLEQVKYERNSWQLVSGGQSITLTTNESGMITFDNLEAGVFYRLTEVSPPLGHLSTLEPVVLTVDGNGLVQNAVTSTTLIELNAEAIRYTTPYNVTVTNITLEPLPETGSMGITVYTQSGLMLMLAAGAVWLIYHKRKRSGRGVSPDA